MNILKVLNRDVQQVMFNFLTLNEKYNYYLICKENNMLTDFTFIERYFNDLKNLTTQEWTMFLIEEPNLHEELLIKYKDIIDWYMVCIYQNLTEDFMETYSDYIDWEIISMHRILTDEFIKKHHEELNWTFLSNTTHLSENIVNLFHQKIDWEFLDISRYSNEFIDEYKLKINWLNTFFEDTTKYEIFKDYVNWERISYHNKLTEDFMRIYQDRLDWNFISSHQQLTSEFIEEFKHKLNMDTVNRFSMHHTSPSLSVNPVRRCLNFGRYRNRPSFFEI